MTAWPSLRLAASPMAVAASCTLPSKPRNFPASAPSQARMRIFSEIGGSACLAILGANSATNDQSSLEIAPVTACISWSSLFIMVRSPIGFAVSTDCAPSDVAKVPKSRKARRRRTILVLRADSRVSPLMLLMKTLGLTNGCYVRARSIQAWEARCLRTQGATLTTRAWWRGAKSLRCSSPIR